MPEYATGTLGHYIALFDALITLHNKGEVRAFLKGERDDSFFTLAREFLLSMRTPDGVDLSRARVDLIAQVNEYVLASKDITDEQYQKQFAQKRGHLKRVV